MQGTLHRVQSAVTWPCDLKRDPKQRLPGRLPGDTQRG